MHFALVTDEYCAPFPTTRGTAINTWSIMQAFLQAGHRVTVIIVSNEKPARFADMEGAGVTVRTLPHGDARSSWPFDRLGSALDVVRPQMETFFGWVRVAPAMRRLLEDVRPNAVLGFNLYNLAATHGVDVCPRMAVFVDLEHMAGQARWHVTPLVPIKPFIKMSVRTLVYRRQPKFMNQLLAQCQSVVDFAAHHVEWLHRHGVPQCLYLPPPTRDPVGARWRELREARPAPSKAKLLLIGHLGGIATITGIEYLLAQILPRLEAHLGTDRFEAHVVGDHRRNPDLAERLRRHPTVRLRGYVNDVDVEFLSSDVLLVPTPIDLGTRTRIIEGFSYGCCVVAHAANALGIPQMVDGENALLARDGTGHVDAVVRALTDAALRRRIETAARRTFEEHFTLETAGAALTAEMVRIAEHRPRVAP